jgi:ketosteroid isomerase-like protein
MSQENVEIVRKGFRAFNERDIDAALADYADDAQWRLIGGFADLMGSQFSGRDAVRGFFAEMIETIGGRAEIERIVDARDQVVVIVSATGVGGESGAPAAVRFGQVYSFRGGQVSVVDNYYDATEALEAVGLRE